LNWTIDFAPLLPAYVLWVAAAVALALTALLFLRRTRGAPFRVLALAALFAALLNPTLKEEERDTLANVAIVVMDQSTSQQLATRPEQSQAIRQALSARLEGIKNLDVKWVTENPSEDGSARGTRLFSTLSTVLATTPPDRIAGVILVSDGQVHDVPEKVAALGFTAPVHALLTGRPDEFDRRIEVIKAPRYGIVGQSRQIEVRVVETGRSRAERAPVSLRIRREGRSDERRQALIGQTIQIEMPFPHAGTNILEIELDVADGELTEANNRVVVAAEGVRENLRVLLVSGEPHAGERTWRNLLKSDAAVDLVHFTILRPPEKQDGTPINQLSLIAFPTRELFSEKIRDFDLIIFDRYQHRGILQLLYYDNISRYVEEHGGAVLVAAGDDYAGNMSIYRTPLAPVLPAVPTGRVIEAPFRAAVTEDGFKHPVTRALPGANTEPGSVPSWGRWFRQVEVQPDRGNTLMKGANDEPLLILDRKGKGRVALLTSDQAWLWARGFDGGGPHTDLLRRLSHWLMKEPDLEEERLIADATGLKVSLQRFTMDETVGPVSVTGPDGETREVVLEKTKDGLWDTTIEVRIPGLYKAQTQARDRTLTAVAHAGAQDVREMREVTATEKKLAPLVEGTGGGIFWTQSAGLLNASSATQTSLPRISMLTNARVFSGSGWLGLKDQEAYLTTGVKLTPLFDGLVALAALLFLLSLAWWREGR